MLNPTPYYQLHERAVLFSRQYCSVELSVMMGMFYSRQSKQKPLAVNQQLNWRVTEDLKY